MVALKPHGKFTPDDQDIQVQKQSVLNPVAISCLDWLQHIQQISSLALTLATSKILDDEDEWCDSERGNKYKALEDSNDAEKTLKQPWMKFRGGNDPLKMLVDLLLEYANIRNMKFPLECARFYWSILRWYPNSTLAKCSPNDFRRMLLKLSQEVRFD